MPATVSDFGRLLLRLLRFLRYASLGVILAVVVLLAFRVAEAYRAAAAVHPLLGVAFLLALGVGVAWLVGRPLYRFLRMPVVLRPPRLPEPDARRVRHLRRHLRFLERYVGALRANPAWDGDVRAIDDASAACRALAREAAGAGDPDLPVLAGKVAAFEREVVERLLVPLDRKASEIIRAEALRVGLATAVSPYGTLDAFLVLWRNASLVSRIATIYYGRPGTRGTLRILRDVFLATLAGAYLQDLADVAGELVGSIAGKTAGFFAGPLMEGCLNAVATLRIGYVAKGRCRAFAPWTERTAAAVTQAALAEAARFSAGLVRDVVRSVGGGVLRLTGHALGNLVERVSALFRRPEPGGETA